MKDVAYLCFKQPKSPFEYIVCHKHGQFTRCNTKFVFRDLNGVSLLPRLFEKLEVREIRAYVLFCTFYKHVYDALEHDVP